MKLERILIAGAGGQGIIYIGKLLASSAVKSIPCVTFFPAYGIEVRGGASHCQVILSDEEISSPVAERFDSIILMNQESTDRFLPLLAENGLAVFNSSLCRVPDKGRTVRVPATEEAMRLGVPRSANLIMLGALLAHKSLIKPETVEARLRLDMAGAVDANLAAFRAGFSAPLVVG